MLPGSHQNHIEDAALGSLRGPELLSAAFSEFISASAQLESSYRDLQREVGQLGTELAERNAALTRSLAENHQMRGALQQILDSMPCGVLVLDTAGRIFTINPEARRLLQLGAEVGPERVRCLEDLATMCKVHLQAPAHDAEGPSDRQIAMDAGGKKRWLAISHRRLSSSSTKASSLASSAGTERASLESIWILRDITASKDAEREREAARNAMALAEVAAILAHEMRNPLASMELFAGLLAEEPAQSELWVSHLRAGIRLLSATVNNVLSLQSGNGWQRFALDLSACIRDGAAFVRPIAEQAGVLLGVDIEDGARMEGNENLLRQVLLNLVCNAIRHTPAGGKVDVRVRAAAPPASRRVLLEVSDTGCGIPAEQKERIFEAGYSAGGGTPGLGLAVCKRLAAFHGGSIRIQSQEGCGSTFQLEFPAI
ncbi:MAG: sensor histidine kinase [Acidobacteriota bacterium]